MPVSVCVCEGGKLLPGLRGERMDGRTHTLMGLRADLCVCIVAG